MTNEGKSGLKGTSKVSAVNKLRAALSLPTST